MKIAYTRAMIRAALSGALDAASYQKDPVFNLDIPQLCPGVPPEVLNPRSTWSDAAAYDAQATQTRAHVRRQLQDLRATVTPGRAAGPRDQGRLHGMAWMIHA